MNKLYQAPIIISVDECHSESEYVQHRASHTSEKGFIIAFAGVLLIRSVLRQELAGMDSQGLMALFMTVATTGRASQIA